MNYEKFCHDPSNYSNLCLINMLMFTVLGIFSFEVSMLFEYLVITRYENNNIIR